MRDLTGKYEFEFEEGAVVNFSRVTGTRGFSCSVEFTTSTAAVRALAIIIEGVAKRLGVPVENVLCKLATVLLQEESQAVEKGDNPSATARHLPLHKRSFGGTDATLSCAVAAMKAESKE